MDRMPIGSREYLWARDSLSAEFRALAASAGVASFSGAGGTFEVHVDQAPAGNFRIMAADLTPKGRLGFRADGLSEKFSLPAGQFIQYLQYPTIVDVEQNSPASRAGIRVGDSLLAYNGFDLRRQAINMTRLLTPGTEVAIKLRRDGDTRDVLLLVERASATLEQERRTELQLAPSNRPFTAMDSTERRMMEARAVGGVARAGAIGGGAGGGAGGFGGGGSIMGRPTATAVYTGVLGAAVQDVDPEFAESINGMKGRTGVFVTLVPPGSVAQRAGLKRGDVILRVENSDVATIPQLRVRLMQAENTNTEKIRLVILRGGKTQELTYDVIR
jgi:serine protease Do